MDVGYPLRVLESGGLYFLVAFGVGFAIGTFRVLFMVPNFGERTSELLEIPIMLVVCSVAARWVVHRSRAPRRPSALLGIGLVALALLLAAELTLVLWLRGLTLDEYLATRDPVSGTTYMLTLGIFAVLPLFVARVERRR